MIPGSYESFIRMLDEAFEAGLKNLTRLAFLRMLEEAFEAGFSAGYHSEDNPADYVADWEEYKKEVEESL